MLYGTNAISAVVRITTIPEVPVDNAEILVSGGELGQLRMYFESSNLWKLDQADLSYSIHAGLEGKRSPSDIRDKAAAPQLHGHVRFRTGTGLDVSLHAGAAVGAGGEGLVSLDLGDIGLADPYTVWTMAKAGTPLWDGAALRGQVYFSHSHSDLRYRTGIYAYNYWIADIAEVSWTVDIVDAKAELDVALADAWHLMAGTHLRLNRMTGEDAILTDDEECRGAGFAMLRWRPGWFQLTGGLRLDLNQDVPPAFSPRIAAVIRPWRNQAFRLSYNAGFRKPSDFESRIHLKAEVFNPAMPESVGLMAESVGNPALKNETVHGFEAGWRLRLPDCRLRLGVDAFVNLHRDTITLHVDVPSRLGAPDLGHSTILYQNTGREVDVLGAELEVGWSPMEALNLWANLTLKQAFDHGTGDAIDAEPGYRLNLGGGYRPVSGMFLDVALHYVSAYTSTLVVPDDPILGRERSRLGDNWLLIGNLGYRHALPQARFLDAGLALRQPLGPPFREIAGTPPPGDIEVLDVSDFGGEFVTRVIWVYLRWSY
jgi:hypothetical protein